MRKYMSVSSVLWCVTKGRAIAPPVSYVQYRSLDLDEAPALQACCRNERDDAAAQDWSVARACSLTHRSTSRWRNRVSVSVTPFPLVRRTTGAPRRACTQLSTPTESSPLRVFNTLPRAPIQSRERQRGEPRKVLGHTVAGEQLDAPRRVVEAGERELSLGAHEHHPARRPPPRRPTPPRARARRRSARGARPPLRCGRNGRAPSVCLPDICSHAAKSAGRMRSYTNRARAA